MKVNRIQFSNYGSASEMYIGEYGLPQLKADEVQISVKAAAINPLDWKQRRGDMKLIMGKKFPKGIGNDFAGIVEAVGANVQNIKVGDEVFGTMDVKKPGAFASKLITQSKFIAKKPTNISFSEASCLPIGATVAWAALFLKTKVHKNTRVLINGCTGAVGSLAVQLAKEKGAWVAGTCSKTETEEAKKIGVDKIFDYNEPNYWKKSELFDVVFDTAGLMKQTDGFSMLKPNGKFVDINPTPKSMLTGLFKPKYKFTFATAGMKHLADIAELVEKGKLKPRIGKEINFENTIDELIKIENGKGVKGRTVIVF
ncbi:NADP-dependent oxidoreductase [Flavobacterium ajazii]|uniref:NADP-dependent oxidoreductase n=1 Tax=Flavobacterium ajazii TaxID=2692318 RepID=UPI001CB6D0B8|nr:NADP-dependent oxidoreductase [Flavobacterium ajazii]